MTMATTALIHDEDRIQYVQMVLEDEEIQSSKELSKDQASRVIDALQQLSGGAE